MVVTPETFGEVLLSQTHIFVRYMHCPRRICSGGKRNFTLSKASLISKSSHRAPQ